MVRKREVFLTQSVTKKSMAFRIDGQVAKALSDLDERIKQEAPSQTFDRHGIVENALRRAIDSVNAELDEAQSNRPSSRSA